MCLRVVVSHVTSFTFPGIFQWILVVNYNFKNFSFFFFVGEAFAALYSFRI